MQEIFYEETANLIDADKAEKKYKIFKIISKICYIVFTFYAIMELVFFVPDAKNVVLSVIVAFFPMIVILTTAIICGKYKNTLYVEYDYTFVSGSIRVAKVIKDFKRRIVIKFDTSNIEKIGHYDSMTYKKYELIPGINKQILSNNIVPNDNKKFYYIVANANGDKNLLVFECTEQFIAYILKFSRKTVLEEGFFKK